MSLKSVRKTKAGEFLNWMEILLIVVSDKTWGSGPLLHMAWYSSLQGTGFNLSKYRWCYEFGRVSHCFVQQGYLCPQVTCIHRFIIHRIIPLKSSRKPKRDPYKYSQTFLLLFSHTVNYFLK